MSDLAGVTSRSRRVVAALAVLWLAGWALAVGAHDVAAHTESAVAQHTHVMLDSLHGGFTLTPGHPHLDRGSAMPHPERLTTAVIPRSSTVLGALMLVGVVGVAAAAGWLVTSGVSPGRGPPVGPAALLAGQDRLIRFCLSRR
ncbi:hypothetical protein [Mycobacterium sp.]|uniref:hypothetical protein n=1 Tax=Mycobacterium sp. TaxID=1785 RepID=UPI0025E83DED|nr:hypothetical protein [Mycobacterium sp.]